VAWGYVDQKNLSRGEVLEMGQEAVDIANLMERIKTAVSCVPQETKIDLIIDQHRCVVFAIPQDGTA
jgi:hypothetical protein